jgi:hypothetical protein
VLTESVEEEFLEEPILEFLAGTMIAICIVLARFCDIFNYLFVRTFRTISSSLQRHCSVRRRLVQGIARFASSGGFLPAQ